MKKVSDFAFKFEKCLLQNITGQDAGPGGKI